MATICLITGTALSDSVVWTRREIDYSRLVAIRDPAGIHAPRPIFKMLTYCDIQEALEKLEQATRQLDYVMNVQMPEQEAHFLAQIQELKVDLQDQKDSRRRYQAKSQQLEDQIDYKLSAMVCVLNTFCAVSILQCGESVDDLYKMNVV